MWAESGPVTDPDDRDVGVVADGQEGRLLEATIVVLAIAARAAAVLVLQSHTVPQQHLRARRDRRQPAGRAGVLGPVPRGRRADLAAGAVYPFAGRGGLRDRGRRDAPRPADPGAGPGRCWAACWSGGVMQARARGRAGVARGSRPLAGLIAAVHPTLVYAATHVQVALLAATLLTATLAWAYRAGRTGATATRRRRGFLAPAGADRPDPRPGRRRGWPGRSSLGAGPARRRRRPRRAGRC